MKKYFIIGVLFKLFPTIKNRTILLMYKYLQEVTNFFIRKGSKTTVEALMYNFVMQKAKLKKMNLHKVLSKCKINATPCLRLKTRKRGKRTIYRVHHLEAFKGYKKSVRNVGQTVGQSVRTSPRQFSKTLDRELQLWSTGKHPALKKRLAVHYLARKNAPFRWFLSKEERQKENKQKKKKASIYSIRNQKMKIAALKYKK